MRCYLRLSYHGGYDNLVVGNTEQRVYTVTDIPSKPGENVTYADLDTRYRSMIMFPSISAVKL